MIVITISVYLFTLFFWTMVTDKRDKCYLCDTFSLSKGVVRKSTISKE